ncbi:MAG: zinc-binding alcohol dehydrogenase [Rhodospirillales bacterium]
MTGARMARAFWVCEPGRGEIRTGPIGPAGDGDVCVRTLWTGISRGTECLVFRGQVPPSQYRAMRCPFQEGDFPAPVKYGYAAVGIVEEGPPGLAGRTVFCLHPHQDSFIVPAAGVMPLSPRLPPARAVLAANMETALNGVWDAGIGPGDRVAVVGAGVVGLLVGWLAAGIPGTEVVVIDPDPARAGIVTRLGGTYRKRPPQPMAGTAFDVVVHASGQPSGLADALAIAGFEATVLELSWYGDALVPLPLGENFHAGRLAIRSSQVGAVAPRQRPRWTSARRLSKALSLLLDDRLDALISGESDFDRLPALMAGLADGSVPALCHRIRY